MDLPNPRTLFLTVLICAVSMFAMADDPNVSKMDVANTDSLFKEIQRTVAEVDFDAMAAAYHVDSTSAFDSGIFHYAPVGKDRVEKVAFIHFENLAVYRDGRWLTLMERHLVTAGKTGSTFRSPTAVRILFQSG